MHNMGAGVREKLGRKWHLWTSTEDVCAEWPETWEEARSRRVHRVQYGTNWCTREPKRGLEDGQVEAGRQQVNNHAENC